MKKNRRERKEVNKLQKKENYGGPKSKLIIIKKEEREVKRGKGKQEN